MYEIEKNVPMPAIVRRHRKSKYPYDKMKIGDSFAVPGRPSTKMGTLNLHAEKRTGFKFSARSDGNGGCRIWRIA